MSDRLSPIEERLRHIDDAVACLERRLEQLERGQASGGSALAASPHRPDVATGELVAAPRSDAVVLLLPLAGRTCLVFGGAYLLRALTESGHIPATSGVLLGLLYAVAWLAAADRAAKSSALFHGLATVLIGLPIVWEAVTRFRILSPAQGAAALTVVVGLALTVAWHRRLQALAAVVVIGALGTSLTLIVALGRLLPFATLLLGVAAASLWIAYHRRWAWLAFLTGLTVDLIVLAAMMRALATPARDPAGAVLVLQTALLALYFGSFATRALVRQPLEVFEFVQGALALAVGLGGAIALAHTGVVKTGAIGIAALAGAAAAYAIAFALRRQHAPTPTLHFFASLGLVLALVGGRLLLSGAPLVFALSASATGTLAIGRWFQLPALVLHGAVALATAALFSGALVLVGQVWFSVPASWPVLTMPVEMVTAAALVCFVVSRPRNRQGDAIMLSGVRTALGVLVVAGLGTFLVIWIGPHVTGNTPEAGSTATVKSLVLAVLAVLLAWTRHLPGLAELGRLTYPLLIAGGLKILLEDLPSSRPATLFVALALYGAALILAPRVLKAHYSLRS